MIRLCFGCCYSYCVSQERSLCYGYIMLYYVMLCYIMRCNMMWCDVMRRDETWCDEKRRDVTRRDVTWRDVTWRDMTWHDVMAAASARKECCRGCCAIQETIKCLQFLWFLTISSSLLAHTLPNLGSANGADSVNSKTIGTVNRMKSGTVCK